MQKHANLVDLVKSFPTNILLQNLASIQKRTSPIKFAYFAEKSEKGSISDFSTKVWPGGVALARALGTELAEHARGRGVEVGAGLGVAADCCQTLPTVWQQFGNNLGKFRDLWNFRILDNLQSVAKENMGIYSPRAPRKGIVSKNNLV